MVEGLGVVTGTALMVKDREEALTSFRVKARVMLSPVKIDREREKEERERRKREKRGEGRRDREKGIMGSPLGQRTVT